MNIFYPKKINLFFLLFFVMLINKGFAQTELLQNNSFSIQNYQWGASGNFQYDNRFTNYHTPPSYAYLANFNGTKGNNLSGTLSQKFIIPSNTTFIRISFWYYVTSDETTTSQQNDICDVAIYEDANPSNRVPLKRITNLNNSSGYSFFSQDVTVTQTNTQFVMFFDGFTNNNNLATTFRIDDVSIQAFNSNCVSWANGIKPANNVASAMEVLCSNNIIQNYQDVSFG
ncbi:MAG: hypothetical protein ACOVNY_02315 [Chitinophagaceae bacterium]